VADDGGKITPTMLVLLIQAVIAVVVLVGYMILTLTGHDGTPMLTVLVGQGVGAGVQATARAG
jgi:hypothetical protein